MLYFLLRYKLSMDGDGKLSSVDMDLACDCGFTTNESTSGDAALFAQVYAIRQREEKKRKYICFPL